MIGPSVGIRVKSGRGIANATPEVNEASEVYAAYRRIVYTTVYNVLDADDEIVGLWSSVYTITHSGDRVVSSLDQVAFEETTEDDPPLGPDEHLGGINADESSVDPTDEVSAGEMRQFAIGRFQDRWVPYFEGLEQAPAMGGNGVSGEFINAGRTELQIMIAEWVPQATLSGATPYGVGVGSSIEIGYYLSHKTEDGTDYSFVQKTVEWNGSEFRNDDPTDSQSDQGWIPFPSPVEAEYDGVDAYNFALNVFPIFA